MNNEVATINSEEITEARVLQLAKEFGNKIGFAAEAILDAGRFYVKVITDFPQARKVFVESFPDFSESRWAIWEMIGRGQLHPSLLTAPANMAKAIGRMPVSVQEGLINKGVEFLLPNGDHILVRLTSLSGSQRRQLFAYDHIRSLPEQKLWLETEGVKQRRRGVVIDSVYKITSKGLTVEPQSGPVFFTKKQLLKFLAEMEG